MLSNEMREHAKIWMSGNERKIAESWATDVAKLERCAAVAQEVADEAMNILVSWQVDWEKLALDGDYEPELSQSTIILQDKLRALKELDSIGSDE